jgi:DNA-binding transcriptional MerR regulator
MSDKTIDSDTVTVYNINMQENEYGLTIEELAERVEVPVRTIRFYISEGLLQGPGTRGKAALYSDEHLLRLRLIRRLSEQRVPVAEMRDLLSRLSLDEVRALLSEEEQRATELERAAQVPSPKEYLSALLNRAQAARQLPSTEKSLSAHAKSAPSTPYLEQSKEIWQRWELAPGVELFIKANAWEQQRTLIERLLRAARVPVDYIGR